MVRKIEGLAFSLIGTVLVFALIGHMLDNFFHQDKLFLAIFIILGFVNVMAYFAYQVYKYVYKGN